VGGSAREISTRNARNAAQIDNHSISQEKDHEETTASVHIVVGNCRRWVGASACGHRSPSSATGHDAGAAIASTVNSGATGPGSARPNAAGSDAWPGHRRADDASTDAGHDADDAGNDANDAGSNAARAGPSSWHAVASNAGRHDDRLSDDAGDTIRKRSRNIAWDEAGNDADDGWNDADDANDAWANARSDGARPNGSATTCSARKIARGSIMSASARNFGP